MKSNRSEEVTCHDMSRRDLFRVGGLSALGLSLAGMFRMQRLAANEEKVTSTNNAKSCILIWLDGGPSHLETFDPKPNAPAEIRGPLDSIATNIAGVRLNECLPQTAKLMKKIAIIRSMTSPLGEHNFGTHYMMTGYKPTPVLAYPAFGSVLAHIRSQQNVLPSHIAIPSFQVGGGKMAGSGYLSAQTQPFSVGGDPSKANFKVRDLDFHKGLNLKRLNRRRQFLTTMNQFHQTLDHSSTRTGDPDLERAYRLISSNQAKKAFSIADEPRQIRQRYGSKSIGQSCLLARRLVECGVSFVTVNNRGWDTHDKLYTRLKEGYTGAKVGVGLIPSLDLALSALIDDLEDRGLLDETLIVVMGEFGRTPKLNTNAGRDHWPRVFSTLLAGGGVQGGQIIGSSDAVGESPKDHPITPSDFAATIYTLLGINPKQELKTSDGRPVRVTPDQAKVISEIVG